MHEGYAVVFQNAESRATGRLEIEQDRLLLSGRGKAGNLELEIPFQDLVEVRVGRRPNERLNGYRTLLLERKTEPTVRVAPLGMAPLPELSDLLSSLTESGAENVLAVRVPLKPGCLSHARKLLAKGPPLQPALLGLSGHEVYLSESEAVFVFRGTDVRAKVGKAARHPAVWRAGLAWQRCFAAPPQVADDATFLEIDAVPTYSWTEESA
jgi:hypothetical protein